MTAAYDRVPVVVDVIIHNHHQPLSPFFILKACHDNADIFDIVEFCKIQFTMCTLSCRNNYVSKSQMLTGQLSQGNIGR